MHSTIAVLTDNTLLGINRLVSGLRGRSFKVVSFTSGRTLAPDVAAATIVVDSEHSPVARVTVCLEKIEQVWNVREVSAVGGVQRELALLKVTGSADGRAAAAALVEAGAARQIDQTGDTLILEVADEPAGVDRAIAALLGHGLHDVVRIGPIAMTRGPEDR
jgi:acetolactate synthase-1/3 small subunit